MNAAANRRVLEPRPKVVIYTHSLLSGSMTFIRSHAEALRRYEAVYAGSHRANGLQLPPERTVVVNAGGVIGAAREFGFRRFGRAHGFFGRLARHRPTLVHAHFGTSGPAGMTIAQRLRIPLVVTFHGKDATITVQEAAKSRRGRELLAARDALIAKASCFIAVSDYIRNELLRQGYPPMKVVTLRNGIDTEYFSPRSITREPIVVFVGRFVEKKGCEYLLDAMGRLKQEHVKARAVLIGDGPLRASLESHARQLGVDAMFTGFLALDEVKNWLNRATVVTVPSVTAANGDSEGLPTVVLEAQAMATPVVATRHSGIPEGVLDRRTATLVRERDTEGLAHALRDLFEDPVKARRFGEMGRSFVSSQFDIVAQVAALEDLYDRTRRSFGRSSGMQA